MTQPDPAAAADRAEEAPLSLGERLAIHRRRAGHSQQSAALATGLSRNLISLIERGEGNPTPETLRRLHAYMGEAEPILTADERQMIDRVVSAVRAGFVAVLVRPPAPAMPMVGMDCVVIGDGSESNSHLIED